MWNILLVRMAALPTLTLSDLAFFTFCCAQLSVISSSSRQIGFLCSLHSIYELMHQHLSSGYYTIYPHLQILVHTLCIISFPTVLLTLAESICKMLFLPF